MSRTSDSGLNSKRGSKEDTTKCKNIEKCYAIVLSEMLDVGVYNTSCIRKRRPVLAKWQVKIKIASYFVNELSGKDRSLGLR